MFHTVEVYLDINEVLCDILTPMRSDAVISDTQPKMHRFAPWSLDLEKPEK